MRLGNLLAALVAALIGACLQPGLAAAVEADGVANVRGYWTEQRMEAAIPLNLTPDPAALANAALPTPDQHSNSAPSMIAPTPQTHAAVHRSLIADPSTYPNRVHGKVFLTIPPFDYVCSGTAIRSHNHSSILTAGHCVHDASSGYATNLIFVPGYDQGDEPYGEWVAQRLFSTPGWVADEDLRYDAGIAVLKRDSQGHGIQDVIGARGIAFNQSRNQFYRSYGYPAAGSFDGERLYRCDSGWGGDDGSTHEPRTMFIACDFTGGSSGGGWVIKDRAVAGLNSYKYDDDAPPVLPGEEPDHMYGPYFGDTIKALYRSAAGPVQRCLGKAVTQLGSGGTDVFTGSDGVDVIATGGGADVVRAGGGDDLICSGSGDDRVRAGSGNDRIRAGAGEDLISGGSGRNDRCTGGAGADRAGACESRHAVR